MVASLSGGDDYELLFALSSRSRGRLRLVERQARGSAADTNRRAHTASGGLVVERGGAIEPLPAGFVHF